MGGGPNQPPLLIGRGSIYLGADPIHRTNTLYRRSASERYGTRGPKPESPSAIRDATPQKVQVHTVHLRLSRRVAPVPYRTVLLSRPGMPIPTDTVILGTGRAAVPLLPYTFPF